VVTPGIVHRPFHVPGKVSMFFHRNEGIVGLHQAEAMVGIQNEGDFQTQLLFVQAKRHQEFSCLLDWEDMPGADEPSYTTDPTTMADDGATLPFNPET